MIFAILPVFALGGIGVPALQSLAARQVSADRKGQFWLSVVTVHAIAVPFVLALGAGTPAEAAAR